MSQSNVEFEEKNDRVIVAKVDGERVAKIVTTPSGRTSYRIDADRRRGGPVDDIDEAKHAIEAYYR